MKIIELTRGQMTKVDDDDFEKLNQFKWHVNKSGNILYAVRNTLSSESKIQTKIRMHRVIMGTPKGLQIDHKDGNGLNNCKSNLRIVTTRQNCQNRHDNSSSIFPGVHWHKRDKKWVARIVIDGKSKHLGYFDIEVDAFNAYSKALKEINEIYINEI